MIKFSNGSNNRKLKSLAEHEGIAYSHIVSFDLPAGYTCPAANICKTYAKRDTGQIIDGKNSTVRCYAASMESRYSNNRKMHWNNLNALLKLDSIGMAHAITEAIPVHTAIVRIHCSGDFFSEAYMYAWRTIARWNDHIQFFGYTKVLSAILMDKPDNLHLIYSHGGIYDQEADKLNIPQAYIVQSLENPPAPIVCYNHINEWEDYIYICNQKSFSIMIHGTQKAKGKL